MILPVDLELIVRAVAGEKLAIEELLNSYQKFVFNIAAKHGPKGEGESIAQDAFVSVFRSISTLRSPETFKSWLHSITLRRCHDAWRTHYRRKEVELEPSMLATLKDPKIDYANNNFDSVWLVEKILSKLSASDRMITTLFYLEDRSVKEVANLLGLTQINVKVRTHRIRKRLEKIFNEITQNREDGDD